MLIPGTNEVGRNEPSVNINIYQKLSNDKLKLVSSKTVSLSYKNPRWSDFDVLSAYQFSINNNLELINFVVICDECNNLLMNSHNILEHKKHSTLNILISINEFVNATSSVRIKRRAATGGSAGHRKSRRKSRGDNIHRSSCSNQQNTTRCCRYPLEVTFQELESFEFIIEPKSYDAGYCKGHCPVRYNPANKHALIQSLMWKKDKRAPKPCCAPKKFASLKIIYLTAERTMKVATWPKMAVTDCACN